MMEVELSRSEQARIRQPLMRLSPSSPATKMTARRLCELWRNSPY